MIVHEASRAKAEGGVLERQSLQAGLSLLFAAGERPCAEDIERLLKWGTVSAPPPRIVHRPDEGEGWLELLASGLSFDLVGLAPGAGTALPDCRHRFGVAEDALLSSSEAIALLPGPHLAGASAMTPVVRTITGLGAILARHLPAKAVCWHPAGSCMEPRYFGQVISGWRSGGAFPALGLTAVERVEDGAVQSVGLRFFIGQEVTVSALPGESPADTAKLAVRIIDYLVKHGALSGPHELRGPDGEALIAEPSRDGRHVRVWRGA